MATVVEERGRIESMDALRGFAVMGILLMNITAFAMPSAAYINPRAFGGTSLPDLIAWAINFVLIDGKMRGLFSLLFGASMLLVIERAEANGQSGGRTHLRRMFWLLVFGLVHAYLIWFGDILVYYAVGGTLVLLLVRKSTDSLIRWAIGLFVLGFVIWGGAIGAGYALQFAATQPGAEADLVNSLKDMLDGFGAPGSADIAQELARYRGSYADALAERTKDGISSLLIFVLLSTPETVGFMALGMALYKNGFLTGAWDTARYRRTMIRTYAIGLPAMVALAAFCWSRGFDVLDMATAMFVVSTPFRVILTIGHAALAMLVIRRFARSPSVARVAAAGRAAFTNYLGTSIVMTTLFYGSGLGWFGTLSRWQLYLVVPVVWAIMLLWSKPWLDRFRFGPLEWLWRSLARGQVQPFRRQILPKP